MKIAVIGAGIVGVTTAYYLAKQGHSVVIIDREEHAAMACSRANGGQMSVCNAETWNTWKNVKKGLGWMFKKDAPLLIRPKPTYAKIKWLAGFLRHTFNGTQLLNTIMTARIGLTARDLYQQIVDEENIQFDQRKEGLLHVYTKQESFLEAIKMQKTFEESGVEWSPINAYQARDLDPSLESFADLCGAIHTPSDWTGDAHQFTKNLLDICVKKYNVQALLGWEVSDVTSKCVTLKKLQLNVEWQEPVDRIVFCNGHEMQSSAYKIGDVFNIYPVKGYSITIDNADTAPGISLLDDDKKIVSSKLGNRFRVAGTAELDGVNYDIRRDRIQPLLNWVHKNFPDIDTSNYSSWACLRPMNSNMMPIVQQSKIMSSVYYNGGHGHLGWTLAPATAFTLAHFLT